MRAAHVARSSRVAAAEAMRDGIRKETLGAPAATGRLRPCRRGGGGAAVTSVARAPVAACRGVTSLREE